MNEVLDNTFKLEEVRADFPILNRKVNGKSLVYFDNGATAQKPKSVIDAIQKYYSEENSNIHRGVHTLSQEATTAYEVAREKMRAYISAAHTEEVIFTKGTTDGINLVASTFGRQNLKEGDEVIISGMEHHSNIVPWQMICEEKGAILKVIPVTNQGELDMKAFREMLSQRTKLVSVVHISNTLGTVNPVKEIVKLTHAQNAVVLIDGAQAVPHMPINVQEIGADFYVFSMHKMFGPTGLGILYGKKEVLEAMPPYQGGGDMIKTVTFEKTTYNELPHKFEAGTPHISGGIATATVIDYLNQLDWESIHKHEADLLQYATQKLKEVEGLRIIGEAKEKASVISFVVDGIHAYDLGVIIDKMGVAVRTGHHCTQPLMQRFGVLGTVRASFAFYNTKEEVDVFMEALNRAINMLK
tara:strand:+ start:337 stop:1575 length:1239 start_codon:yes stop_codon:yes gene_type:complete